MKAGPWLVSRGHGGPRAGSALRPLAPPILDHTVLGLFHVISAFCATDVPQNAEITRKSSSTDHGAQYQRCSLAGQPTNGGHQIIPIPGNQEDDGPVTGQ